MWFSPLHRAEWAHAISRHVLVHKMSATEPQGFHTQHESDLATGFWLDVEMPEKAFELCTDLAVRYGPRLGVRTLDSRHVASALELKAEQFWTFDERQAKLAKAEGLKI